MIVHLSGDAETDDDSEKPVNTNSNQYEKTINDHDYASDRSVFIICPKA